VRVALALLVAFVSSSDSVIEESRLSSGASLTEAEGPTRRPLSACSLLSW
jgi:hypothetical protein